MLPRFRALTRRFKRDCQVQKSRHESRIKGLVQHYSSQMRLLAARRAPARRESTEILAGEEGRARRGRGPGRPRGLRGGALATRVRRGKEGSRE